MDKQIIIDGVDVSGCIVFNNKYGTKLCNHTDDIREAIHCNDSPNCLYKKFKRKEQEHKETQKALAKCWIENGRLKKECEELKEQLEIAKQNYSLEYEFKMIYIQTLTEIKEIAEEKAKVNDWLALDILQKICECEGQ